VVAGFNSRVGFIWDDSTIIRMLKLALSKINTGDPMADYNYTLETAPDAWKDAAAVGAAAHCLSKEAARWAAEEFGYSLNGVSLDVNKAATYQQLASAYQAEFDEWIPNLTANRPCSAGVRQYKFLLG
jgi:hypothetical protein